MASTNADHVYSATEKQILAYALQRNIWVENGRHPWIDQKGWKLPPSLLRQSSTLEKFGLSFTPNKFKDAKLCDRHKWLNIKVIMYLFELVEAEVGPNLDLCGRDLFRLYENPRDIIQTLRRLNIMWLGEESYRERYKLGPIDPKDWEETWTYQENKCHACMIVRIVKDHTVLTYLRTVTYLRTTQKARRDNGDQVELLSWVDKFLEYYEQPGKEDMENNSNICKPERYPQLSRSQSMRNRQQRSLAAEPMPGMIRRAHTENPARIETQQSMDGQPQQRLAAGPDPRMTDQNRVRKRPRADTGQLLAGQQPRWQQWPATEIEPRFGDQDRMGKRTRANPKQPLLTRRQQRPATQHDAQMEDQERKERARADTAQSLTGQEQRPAADFEPRSKTMNQDPRETLAKINTQRQMLGHQQYLTISEDASRAEDAMRTYLEQPLVESPTTCDELELVESYEHPRESELFEPARFEGRAPAVYANANEDAYTNQRSYYTNNGCGFNQHAQGHGNTRTATTGRATNNYYAMMASNEQADRQGYESHTGPSTLQAMPHHHLSMISSTSNYDISPPSTPRPRLVEEPTGNGQRFHDVRNKLPLNKTNAVKEWASSIRDSAISYYDHDLSPPQTPDAKHSIMEPGGARTEPYHMDAGYSAPKPSLTRTAEAAELALRHQSVMTVGSNYDVSPPPTPGEIQSRTRPGDDCGTGYIGIDDDDDNNADIDADLPLPSLTRSNTTKTIEELPDEYEDAEERKDDWKGSDDSEWEDDSIDGNDAERSDGLDDFDGGVDVRDDLRREAYTERQDQVAVDVVPDDGYGPNETTIYGRLDSDFMTPAKKPVARDVYEDGSGRGHRYVRDKRAAPGRLVLNHCTGPPTKRPAVRDGNSNGYGRDHGYVRHERATPRRLRLEHRVPDKKPNVRRMGMKPPPKGRQAGDRSTRWDMFVSQAL
ncbi:hypothetical protein AJ79_06616 [Helicocarpus griseus UAMH5409]|uniref:Uncharacterized protein n=1 Tax=Helicocarpus griseus UAMH5409 TaxID=1447875 RepID=A0A2B7XBH4_9EURO|nr:hypothetical protein AJ79_06616 [Helicocarpus griseus UAMH5409]